MAIKLQLRRDTTQNWYEINPILSEGEFGVEFFADFKLTLVNTAGVFRWCIGRVTGVGVVSVCIVGVFIA